MPVYVVLGNYTEQGVRQHQAVGRSAPGRRAVDGGPRRPGGEPTTPRWGRTTSSSSSSCRARKWRWRGRSPSAARERCAPRRCWPSRPDGRGHRPAPALRTEFGAPDAARNAAGASTRGSDVSDLRGQGQGLATALGLAHECVSEGEGEGDVGRPARLGAQGLVRPIPLGRISAWKLPAARSMR